MAITTDLTTAIGQVRFAIGDDAEGAGVLPSGANYTDGQITFELGAVGQSVPGACARLCGNLARRWATLPQSFTADGLSVNRGDMVAKWKDMQAAFESEAQGGDGGTVTLDRRDAWSVQAEQGGTDLLRESDTTYTE